MDLARTVTQHEGTLTRHAETLEEHSAELKAQRGCMEELGGAVLGTRRTDFAGGGREPDGLVHDMAAVKTDLGTVKDRLANGGLLARLPSKDRVLLYCALITGISGIIASVVK